MQKNDSMKSIKVQVDKEYKLDGEVLVKLSKQGEKHAETVWTERQFAHGTIKKISKEEYVVVSTGEIKEYKHGSEKTIPNVLRTMARLEALIRTNFTEEGYNQLFLTLSYEKNMMDERQLYKDYDKFMKRLRYAYPEHNFEYIAVAEPQGRGAWHFHVMLKSDKPVLYIENVEPKTLDMLWRHGTTSSQRLKSNDVGRYYVTYFTDMLNEKNEKKRKKHSRLSLYPPNFKFYRCSRGIKQPEVSEMEWQEVQKIYGKPIYEVTYKVINFTEDGEIKEEPIQTIHKASFRKKNS